MANMGASKDSNSMPIAHYSTHVNRFRWLHLPGTNYTTPEKTQLKNERKVCASVNAARNIKTSKM